jgi:hypothetical protein
MIDLNKIEAAAKQPWRSELTVTPAINPATVLEMVSMIRDRDAVLRLALEALEFVVGTSAPMTGQQGQCWPGMKEAINAIREVLEP